MSERPAGRERSGVVHMVHAALWFAVMSTLVKLASERLPTMQIVFARGFVTLGLAAASLAHVRKSPFGGRSGLLFLRGPFLRSFDLLRSVPDNLSGLLQCLIILPDFRFDGRIVGKD